MRGRWKAKGNVLSALYAYKFPFIIYLIKIKLCPSVIRPCFDYDCNYVGQRLWLLLEQISWYSNKLNCDCGFRYSTTKKRFSIQIRPVCFIGMKFLFSIIISLIHFKWKIFIVFLNDAKCKKEYSKPTICSSMRTYFNNSEWLNEKCP